MRIGLDLTALLPKATGIDRYLLELLRALAVVDARNRYSVFINREDRHRLPPLPARFQIIPASTRARAVRLVWQQALLPVVAAHRRLDVLHSPSFILPLTDRRTRHVLTVHDLTSLTHPETHLALRRGRPYCAALRASARRADRVCVPSRAVGAELGQLVSGVEPSRIRVIAHGVADRFSPQQPDVVERVRRRLGLPPRYVLFVGTIQPRKNLEMLLGAYAELVASGDVAEDLVLAGERGWSSDAIVAPARAPQLRDRVHLPGYVDDRELPALYTGARAFVYPSLAEGFGLPPLEAMACGVPVVASDAPALRENLAGAAELVAPEDRHGLADAMRRVLTDEGLRTDRRRLGLERARRFRWEAAARATLACYEDLAPD